MPRPLITQRELEDEIANWLSAHPEHELHEQVERAQMELATPGTWEVAKVTPENDSQFEVESNHDDDQGRNETGGQGQRQPAQPSHAEPQSEGM